MTMRRQGRGSSVTTRLTGSRQTRGISSERLIQAIERELRNDRDLSTREITRRLRQAGFRAGNERVRALTRVARLGAVTGVGGLLGRVLSAGVGGFASRRQFEAAAVATGGQRADRRTGQYVRIAYTAVSTIPYTLHGRVDSETVRIRGSRNFPLPFRPELLVEQASRQLGGLLLETIGELPTDGPVQANVGRIDADITIEGVTLI